jgi:hypothetical protein
MFAADAAGCDAFPQPPAAMAEEDELAIAGGIAKRCHDRHRKLIQAEDVLSVKSGPVEEIGRER